MKIVPRIRSRRQEAARGSAGALSHRKFEAAHSDFGDIGDGMHGGCMMMQYPPCSHVLMRYYASAPS